MASDEYKLEVINLVIIHQALFGYSNGHHLISSSTSFNNKTLKILETLSDLTGTTISTDFDGYLTGYSLPEEKIYVISKTWFANEMPRPGCVWTHSLIIPFNTHEAQLQSINFDTLFTRPNISLPNYIEFYSNPIKLNFDGNLSIYNNINSLSKLSYDCLSLIIENSEPIIITANKCDLYNYALEEIIKCMGISFIKDISFCTGAFSLRIMGETTFTIQIVPQSISKSKLRTNFKTKIISTINDSLFDVDLIYNKDDLKEAISFLFESEIFNLNIAKIKYVLELFLNLKNNKNISVKNIIDNCYSIFEQKKFISKISYIVFNQLLENNNFDSKILIEFCTLDSEYSVWKNNISDEMISFAVSNLLQKEYGTILSVFKQLIDSNLNEIGEVTIKKIANGINNTSFIYFLNDSNYNALKTLLSFNQKFALNCDIWKLPIDIQYDIIKIISHEYESNKNDLFYGNVILLIYNTSQYDLSSRIYDSFNEFAINVFFEWIQSNKNNFNCTPWVNVCSYNSVFTVNKLNDFKLPETAFRQIISTLDPFENELLNCSIDIWLNLYNFYCQKANDISTQNAFALFLLPIILRSKEIFPTELNNFAFSSVHSILARDQMDYFKWEKLSAFLPDVPLYSMWDKCKRLRKAAKNKNVTINLKKCK